MTTSSSENSFNVTPWIRDSCCTSCQFPSCQNESQGCSPGLSTDVSRLSCSFDISQTWLRVWLMFEQLTVHLHKTASFIFKGASLVPSRQTKLGKNWQTSFVLCTGVLFLIYAASHSIFVPTSVDMHTYTRRHSSNKGERPLSRLEKLFLLSMFMTHFVNHCKNTSPAAQTIGSAFCFKFGDLLYLSDRNTASMYCKQGRWYSISRAVTNTKTDRQRDTLTGGSNNDKLSAACCEITGHFEGFRCVWYLLCLCVCPWEVKGMSYGSQLNLQSNHVRYLNSCCVWNVKN